MCLILFKNIMKWNYFFLLHDAFLSEVAYFSEMRTMGMAKQTWTHSPAVNYGRRYLHTTSLELKEAEM